MKIGNQGFSYILNATVKLDFEFGFVKLLETVVKINLILITNLTSKFYLISDGSNKKNLR